MQNVLSRTLKSNSDSKVSGSSESKSIASYVATLFAARTSIHNLHLKISGSGSFAAHKALNELYDDLPDLADGIAESYQGLVEVILDIPVITPTKLSSVNDALSLIRSLISDSDSLQKIVTKSSIINEIDNVKSTLGSIKYKLLFLK